MTSPASLRTQTEQALRLKGVPRHPNLPYLDWQSIRGPRSVAERLMVLYCIAGLAYDADPELLRSWVHRDDFLNFFEPEEWDLLSKDTHSREELNEAGWRQESVYVAAWALGIVEELAWPDAECDLSPVFPQIPEDVPTQEFLRDATIRGSEDILAAADLYYCLDASLRHDELWGGAPASSRYPMVPIVMERRTMLEWLISNEMFGSITLDT